MHRAGRTVLVNLSGYDGADLAAFVERGRLAAGVRRAVVVVATSSPIRSRGCATVGVAEARGFDMVLAIASPSRWSLRRLARLVDHEMLHLRGRAHGQMNKKDLYSLGPTPAWARGLRLRYRGRAPSQIP